MNIESMNEYERSNNLTLSEIDALTMLQQRAEKDGREYLAQFEEDQQQGQ